MDKNEMNKEAPEKIYLQWNDLDDEFGVLWREDKIFDGDIEYIRADKVITLDWKKFKIGERKDE